MEFDNEELKAILLSLNEFRRDNPNFRTIDDNYINEEYATWFSDLVIKVKTKIFETEDYFK